METKTVRYQQAGAGAGPWHLVISAVNETNRLLAEIGTLLENAAREPQEDAR